MASTLNLDVTAHPDAPEEETYDDWLARYFGDDDDVDYAMTDERNPFTGQPGIAQFTAPEEGLRRVIQWYCGDDAEQAQYLRNQIEDGQ